MAEEYEVVSHSHIQCLNLFLVRLFQRTVHIHQDFELGLVLSGDLTVKVEQNTALLSQNDVFLINPMEAHEFTSPGNGALILTIQFSPRLLENVLQDVRNLRFESAIRIRDYFVGGPQNYEKLHAICLETAYCYFQHGPGYEYKCLSLVSMLFFTLQSALPWKIQSEKDLLAMRFRMKRILQITNYIDRNFQRKILLGELAEKEQLTLAYLSHFFKDMLGMTFQDYVNKRRFEYACELVEKTERSILDISIESGFSDVRYLNRMFSQHFGCTPREYRKNRSSHRQQPSVIDSTAQFIYPAEDGLLLIGQLRNTVMERMSGLTFWQFFQ